MDWPMMEDLYLALTRIFGGFITFICNIFGIVRDEEEAA